jgi:hypothetical protein
MERKSEVKKSIIEVVADDGATQIFSLADVKKDAPMTDDEWMVALEAIGYTRSGIVEIQ